jgi:hypothetical protein
MSGVTGDFNGLGALQGRLKQLTGEGLRREGLEAMGTAALKELADEFRGSRDPYGQPWKPPVLRRGRPLENTGRMKASPFYRVEGRNLRVSIPVHHAKTHQDGAEVRPVRASVLAIPLANGGVVFARHVTIPRRRLVPTRKDGGLGPIWTRSFNAALARLLRRVATGKEQR